MTRVASVPASRRNALVLPHPHVLNSARIERPRTDCGPFVVAVHAKSVRVNMDLPTVLDALVPAVADCRRAQHRSVRGPRLRCGAARLP